MYIPYVVVYGCGYIVVIYGCRYIGYGTHEAPFGLTYVLQECWDQLRDVCAYLIDDE